MRVVSFVLGALLCAGFCSLGAACIAPDDPAAGCGLAPAYFDNTDDVQAEDGEGACGRIERTKVDDGDAICKACPFDLHRVVAVRGAERFDITDPAALEYVPSHHNWSDVARATLPDGRALELTVQYGATGGLSDPEAWTLDGALIDDDGEVLDGPWSMRMLGNAW